MFVMGVLKVVGVCCESGMSEGWLFGVLSI